MHNLTYDYSQLSSDSVAQLISENYNIGEDIRCHFYVRGLHDNYLVNDGEKYILRIYRNSWRSSEDINFELELLAHLAERKARVAAPRYTKTGNLCFQIDYPEGARKAALFSYAKGFAPGKEISIRQSNLLGATVAEMHQLGSQFETSHHRQPLDVPYLLDESVQVILAFLCTDQQNYVLRLQDSIRRALTALDLEDRTMVFCSGDVNPTNFHINENQEITLFDFDQCGWGYRAFEIAKFIASLHNVAHREEKSKAFIDGYQGIFPITPVEISTIPHFVQVAHLWVMAIHVYNSSHIGYKYLERTFWDQQLAKLKQLELLE